MGDITWTVLDDAESVAKRACELIGAAARRAISARGSFSLVLAGGSTPRRCYELLRDTPQEWARWQFYFGDERCLASDDPERNSRMASQAMLAHLPIVDAQIHAIPAECGPVAASRAYEPVVAGALPFDLVLLGMGEDGHTASVFPGNEPAGEYAVHAVFDAPKPPPERVTLSLEALADSREVLYLVTGASKRDAVRAWRGGDTLLPVARLRPAGRCEVLLDRNASGPANSPA